MAARRARTAGPTTRGRPGAPGTLPGAVGRPLLPLLARPLAARSRTARARGGRGRAWELAHEALESPPSTETGPGSRTRWNRLPVWPRCSGVPSRRFVCWLQPTGSAPKPGPAASHWRRTCTPGTSPTRRRRSSLTRPTRTGRTARRCPSTSRSPTHATAGGERGRPQTGWGSLTPPPEREVARLVAGGCNNPEIGERLVVTVNTVKTHLSHVYPKLGVEGRPELAAQAARRERPSGSLAFP